MTRKGKAGLVQDELVRNINLLDFSVNAKLATGTGILDLKQQNWPCLHFCISWPHPFLATPIFPPHVKPSQTITDDISASEGHRESRFHSECFSDEGLQLSSL